MKKKFLSFMLACICVLSLVGCGGGNSNDDTGKQDTQKENNSNSISSTEVNYLSKCFSADADAIWYYVNETSKDAEIRFVYICKNGVFKTYRLNDTNIKITLGQVAKMTDEEIISLIEQEYISYLKNDFMLEEKIKTAQNGYTQLMSLIQKGEVGTWKVIDNNLVNTAEDGLTIKIPISKIEEYGNQVNNFSANIDQLIKKGWGYSVLHIYTDNSGNNTKSENVFIGSYHPYSRSLLKELLDFARADPNSLTSPGNYGDVDTLKQFFAITKDETGDNQFEYRVLRTMDMFCFEEDNYTFKISNAYDATRGSIQIYDSYYGGYHVSRFCNSYGLWSDTDSSLITRVPNQTSFGLDSPGTENILVD